MRRIQARRLIRDDSGRHVETGPIEEFIEVDGLLYSMEWLKSVPGISQLNVCVVGEHADAGWGLPGAVKKGGPELDPYTERWRRGNEYLD